MNVIFVEKSWINSKREMRTKFSRGVPPGGGGAWKVERVKY